MRLAPHAQTLKFMMSGVGLLMVSTATLANLYMTEGDRDEQIKKAVTSVAFMFEIKGMNTNFINVALVNRGRAATSYYPYA